MTSLVRSGPRPEDDLDTLRARLSQQEAALDERLAELSELKAQLAEFRLRYRRDVGLLHEELDELEQAIAEAELGEMARRLEEEGGAQPSSSAPSTDPAPRYTSDAVRRLFRDVARTIHPDLARDEHTRDRRHALMVEANRAYALGDEERLRSILEAWENSPEAVQGSDPEAVRLRLERRLAQIGEQLTACAREVDALKDAPLWHLKVMVDEASARGKDLVADTVRRLKRDIIAARNRLDAMRWQP
jgi:hypothetical protein